MTTVVKERAVVELRLGDAQEAFFIYLPREAIPENMALVLKAVQDPGRHGGGQLAADILGCVSPKVGAELFFKPRLASFLDRADWKYDLTKNATGLNVAIQRTDLPHYLFNGCLEHFIRWGSETQKFVGLLYKTVAFAYNGGSVPGGKRTVRVEEVVRDGDKTMLKGYDLGKVGPLKEAYRSYDVSLISGEIEVL